jgi:predicted HTH transcriptional regulator
MNIVDGGDEYLKPPNVGVMFFNESPDHFFPGTQIDVVQFPQGVSGDNIVEKDGGHDGGHDLSSTEKQILAFCSNAPATSDEIHLHLGYKTRTRNVREALAHMISLGLIEYTLPDKPKSKKQKYLLTSSGKQLE